MFSASPGGIELATVAAVATPWGDLIESGSIQLTQLAGIEVRFSQEMDPASVANLANWGLELSGSDASQWIQDVHYQQGTAHIDFVTPLRAEDITLTALDSIFDTLGRPLDGDNDSLAGGHFTLAFGIQQELYAVAPAAQLFGVNTAGGILTPRLEISENGGYAVALIESSANNLQYQGTAITTGTNDSYRPQHPRTYLQIYAENGERLGPLNYERVGQIEDLQAAGADEYLLIGLMNSYYYQENHRYDPSGPLEWKGAEWFSPGISNSSSQSSAYLTEYYRYGNSYYNRKIALGSTSSGSHKDIAYDENLAGELVATWATRQQSSGPYQIYARRFSTGHTALSEPIRIDFASTDQAQPKIALAADGSWTVTWTTLVGGASRGVFARRYSADGVPLGNVIEIRSAAEPITSSPQVLTDSSGRTVIVWGEPQRVMASVLEGNTPSTPIGWAVGEDRDVHQVFSAIDMHGALQVGWLQESPAGAAAPYAIYSQRFSLGHGATVDLNGAPVGDDFTGVTRLNVAPVPAVDASGLAIRHATTQNFVSATLRINDPLAGDLLTIDTSGTELVANYADGVLTISGVDGVENYERVLRTVQFSSTADRVPATFVEIGFSLNDGYFAGPETFSRLHVYVPGSNRVVNRYVSYKGMYDETYSYPSNENAGVPPNKEAYLPGSGPATFANMTGYERGINRIIVETYGRRGGITAADFSFRVGTSPDPSQWAAAPAPSKLTIAPSRMNPDRDRITIEWPDGAIKNTWLEVTLAANVGTALAQPDVFYYGNLVGDTGEGNSPILAMTSAADVLGVRRMRNVYPYASNHFDLNRDHKIDTQDEAIIRANYGVLRMLNLPASGAPATPLAEDASRATLDAVAIALAAPAKADASAGSGDIQEAISVTPSSVAPPARQALHPAALAFAVQDELGSLSEMLSSDAADEADTLFDELLAF